MIFQSESRKRIYLAKVDIGAEEHDSRNFLIKKILSYNVAIAFWGTDKSNGNTSSTLLLSLTVAPSAEWDRQRPRTDDFCKAMAVGHIAYFLALSWSNFFLIDSRSSFWLWKYCSLYYQQLPWLFLITITPGTQISHITGSNPTGGSVYPSIFIFFSTKKLKFKIIK